MFSRIASTPPSRLVCIASGARAGNYIKRNKSQILDAFCSSSMQAERLLGPILASSQIATDLGAEINENGKPDSITQHPRGDVITLFRQLLEIMVDLVDRTTKVHVASN